MYDNNESEFCQYVFRVLIKMDNSSYSIIGRTNTLITSPIYFINIYLYLITTIKYIYAYKYQLYDKMCVFFYAWNKH